MSATAPLTINRILDDPSIFIDHGSSRPPLIAAQAKQSSDGITVPNNQNKRKAFSKAILDFLLSQWFLISYALIIVISHLAPSVAKRNGTIHSEITFSYGALALIFLISGLTMPTKTLISQYREVRVHITTLAMCFLITPAIGFAIVQCIIHSPYTSGQGEGTDVERLLMAGIVIMVCTPTTVASNITFTRLSGGNDATALIEVTIANLLGIFISPALIQGLVRPSMGLGIGSPTKGVGPIYVALVKHFGLALYLPLFLGQVIRAIDTERIDRVAAMMRLKKWNTFCLLALTWETFSDAFASGAFKLLANKDIVLLVFLNLGMYPLFTALCFMACRTPLPSLSFSRGWNGLGKTRGIRVDAKKTVAVCFCGPPKSITVGIVLLFVQYSDFNDRDRAILSIPLALYQGMQIAIAQCFVPVFRWWLARTLTNDNEMQRDGAGVGDYGIELRNEQEKPNNI